MGFVLEEMLEFTAEAVVAGVQTSDYGGRRVLMTGVVRQGRIRKILPKTTTVTDEMRDLLAVYKLSKNFVRFARKQNSEFSLVDTLALFARDHVIKICEVSNEVVDRCVGENDLWKLAKNLLISIPMTVGENVVIAPTAVLKGRVILADRAVVDDLAIIEGPAYVGVGSKVGRFCNILPETILESGVQVGTYAEVSSSMVAAGSKIESRTTIYDQILEAGLGETKNQPRKRG
jgi:NDP-sugar pyrophosphorylase family protein